jgi:WD40 repeat protein
VRILAGHRGPIRALAYAPGDPAALASAGDDGTVRLWSTGTGQAWATLPVRGRREAALALAFAPPGALVVGRRDGSLERWNIATQAQEAGLCPFEGPVGAVAVSPEGRLVLAAPLDQGRRAGEGGRLLRWRPGEQPPLERLSWSAGILCLAFAPDGRTAALGDDQRGVEVWQREPWRRQLVVRFANRVRGLAYSPAEGRTLAVASGRVVETWDLAEARRRLVCRGHRADVHGLAFTPDGAMLLSGAADRTVRLWDAESGRELAAWNWEVGRVLALAVSPDGMTAAAGGDRREVVVWDLGP